MFGRSKNEGDFPERSGEIEGLVNWWDWEGIGRRINFGRFYGSWNLSFHFQNGGVGRDLERESGK